MSYYLQRNDSNPAKFVTPEGAETNSGWLSLCWSVATTLAAWIEEDGILGNPVHLCPPEKRELIRMEADLWGMHEGEHAYNELPWIIVLPAMNRMPETRIRIWADFIGPMAWPWVIS